VPRHLGWLVGRTLQFSRRDFHISLYACFQGGYEKMIFLTFSKLCGFHLMYFVRLSKN
jgi:hypothetical protein